MIVRSETIGVLTNSSSPLVASTAKTGLVRKWVTERRLAVASSHRPTTGGAPYMSSGTAINTISTCRPICTDSRYPAPSDAIGQSVAMRTITMPATALSLRRSGKSGSAR